MNFFYRRDDGSFRWQRLIYHLIVAIITIVIVMSGLIYQDVKRVLKSTHQEVDVTQKRQEEVDVTQGEPLNILLLGTDGNNLERTKAEGFAERTDTIMVVSVNPKQGTTKMLSIPRDTYTMIEGEVFPDKINHAYAYGGAGLVTETVQEFLDIPIDYYAEVNMSGLEKLIDAMGGIEVTSPLTFNYRGTGFVKDETRHVNGVKAMNFARMRYDDPQGEMGRQDRQKIVIKGIIDKLLSLDSISKYREILNVVAKHVKTNFDLTTALTVYPKYMNAVNKLEKVEFESFEDLNIDGVYYLYLPLSSRVKASNELRSLTDLSPIMAKNLIDPLGNMGTDKEITKTTTFVLNQYPTGEGIELDQIIETQSNVQQVRQEEQLVVPVAPVTHYEPTYDYYQPIPDYNYQNNYGPAPNDNYQGTPPIEHEPTYPPPVDPTPGFDQEVPPTGGMPDEQGPADLPLEGDLGGDGGSFGDFQ